MNERHWSHFRPKKKKAKTLGILYFQGFEPMVKT